MKMGRKSNSIDPRRPVLARDEKMSPAMISFSRRHSSSSVVAAEELPRRGRRRCGGTSINREVEDNTIKRPVGWRETRDGPGRCGFRDDPPRFHRL